MVSSKALQLMILKTTRVSTEEVFPEQICRVALYFPSFFEKPAALVMREFTGPLFSVLFYWLACLSDELLG